MYRNNLECLSQLFTFTLVFYLQARLEPTRMELLTGLQAHSKLLALPKNIRLEWKWMKVANTLAYYDMAAIDAVKTLTTAGV